MLWFWMYELSSLVSTAHICIVLTSRIQAAANYTQRCFLHDISAPSQRELLGIFSPKVHLYLGKCCLMLTLSFVVEAVGFDNLLLNLGGHGEHQLQHLAHVVAGTFSSLLHPCSVFWYREGLDHLTQYHCEGNKQNLSSCYASTVYIQTQTHEQWLMRSLTKWKSCQLVFEHGNTWERPEELKHVLHFLAYNRFFSPLVCSTVRVGCCAGAEAMSGEKRDNNLNSDVYRDQDEQTQLYLLLDCLKEIKWP